MRFAEPNASAEFVAKHGFGALVDAKRMPGKSLLRYNFESEDHTSSVYTIAKFLAGLSQEKQSTLVVLDLMYVWPSGRDEHLIRHALESMIKMPAARLKDGTAILWEPTEEVAATTLYHLALLFGWDAHVFPKSGSASAFISHDGFVELFTDGDPVEMAANALRETCRTFDILGEQNLDNSGH